MTDIASNIQNSNWSLSTSAFGAVVTGVTEINQTIGLILSTRKGTDPFRPTFGSDIWEHIDTPIDVAGPNIVRAITEALERWENRIKIVSITYETQPQGGANPSSPSGLVFNITWKLIGGTEQELINLLIGVDSANENVIFVLGTEDNNALSTESNALITI